MNSGGSDDRQDSHSEYLGRVIADYLLAGRSDEPDVEALIAEHPELANSLRDFFDAHLQIRRLGAQAKSAPLLQDERSTAPMGLDADSLSTDQQLSGVPQETLGRNGLPIHESNRFGSYELLEEIARGGMGVVYKARQVRLNRIVALKMIRAGPLADEDIVRRFLVEATAVARLEHPSIVPIYEVGQVNGQHFFSMAYVEGGTLTDKVKSGPLPPRVAADLVMKVADAIEYAHVRGIVHRDLKPGNILLDPKGEPKVTDFGLAKQLGEEGHLTITGQILGTPAYMPPEQAAGKMDSQSTLGDVYSLGAILYHLLTGTPPFQATGPLDIMLQVLGRDLEPPSKRNRSIPRVLEKVCQRAMEKRPEDRYQSAARLASDLRDFLRGEPVTFPNDHWQQRLQRWWRREPLLVAHWVGILSTMCIAWLHKWVYGTELEFVLRHTYVFATWAAVCVGLQKWMNIARWRETASLAWGAIDALLFTLVLYMAGPPRGSLLVGYAVLIACSGLFLRVRYVVLMTSAALLSLLSLVLLQKDDLWKSGQQYMFIVAACLIVIGLAVGTMVKQMRILRQYYEREN